MSGQTERSLAEAMHCIADSRVKGAKPGSATRIADYGTSLKEMHRLLSAIDSIHIVESSFRSHYTRKELVKAGDLYPVCDRSNLYPTFATPDYVGDDILIFADPYDTSDHWQDGYTIVPLERFFYSWKDRAIAPKPYQLQSFPCANCFLHQKTLLLVK